MKNNIKKPASVRQADAYKSEYYDTLNHIWKDNSRLTEIRYFLDTAYNWSDEEQKQAQKPEVVILGTGIPEKLVMAAGAKPYWIIGGSLSSIAWSDDMVPRDTDPVSRSILGYIHQPNGADFSNAMFIIPLSSDSMRKIAFELKAEGRKICIVDIPPDKTDKRAQEKWLKQMYSMTEAVANHTGTRVTRKSVSNAVKRVSMARRTLRQFLEVSRGCTDIITDAARLLVQNTYYMTNSLDEWTQHIEALTEETADFSRNMTDKNHNRPGVLLLGSPVIYPNYKVPFLVRDIGLDILNSADSATLKTYIVYDRKTMRGSCRKLICNIASVWYDYDASSAFVKNDILYRYVSWLIKKGDIEGVVYHVLKGQIEYDFELERFETLLSKYSIPVFRLETDYQYQDVEQLRIRMEAFSEMLVQNRYRAANERSQYKTIGKEVKKAS